MRLNPIAQRFSRMPDARLVADEIQCMPEPEYVVLPMDYRQRELYTMQVEIGQSVRKHQIIARNSIGVCLQTPISGTVFDIKPVWSGRGTHVPALCITRGEGEPCTTDEIFEQYGVSRAEATIDDQLKVMGIHPPWLPLAASAVTEAHTPEAINKVVIIGYDEEPGISIQHNLLAQKTDKVLAGLELLRTIMPNAAQTLLTDKQTAGRLRTRLPDSVELMSVSPHYEERLLATTIPRLMHVDFDPRRDYAQQGVVAISIERLLVLMAAIKDSRPFTTKHLTVSSKKPARQRTIRIQHGTSIRSVLEFAGFVDYPAEAIIVGGPLKGVAQFNDLTPLTRSCDGVHLIAADDITSNPGESCTNCGACTRICPVNLQVHLIGRYAEFGDYTTAREYHPELCLECGLCAYVCPAQRPLVQLVKLSNQYGKQKNEHKPQTECSIESPLEEWNKHCSSAAAVADRPAAHR